jgi:hypothetical protein
VGPLHVPVEAKRFRHVAVAIPEVRVRCGIAVSPGQQCAQPQQQDVAHSYTVVRPRGRQPLDCGLGFGRVTVGAAIEQCSTRTPVAGMPPASSCPSRTRWSTAARRSGMASSRSPRRAWFLDDNTEGARPPLPLKEAGVFLRLRRQANGDEESTVKMRPCRLSQLPHPWNVAKHDDKQYRIEGDWSGTRHVLAASCDGVVELGTIENVTAAYVPVSDLFSERQHDFLAACAEIRVALSGLTVFKGIDACKWTDSSVGAIPHVAAERWTVDGLDFLELCCVYRGGRRKAAAAVTDR